MSDFDLTIRSGKIVTAAGERTLRTQGALIETLEPRVARGSKSS